jgi:hypothetical protein
MERVPVSSENLSSVGYDADSQTLEIAFNRGGVYQYAGVPESKYEGLMSASSHGTYFHANIRNRYPFTKL